MICRAMMLSLCALGGVSTAWMRTALPPSRAAWYSASSAWSSRREALLACSGHRLTPSLPVMNSVYGSTDSGSSSCWRISSAKSSGSGTSSVRGTATRNSSLPCRHSLPRPRRCDCSRCATSTSAWSPTSALMFSLTETKWSMSTCISISGVPPEAASATMACSSGLPAPSRSGASSMLTRGRLEFHMAQCSVGSGVATAVAW